MATIVKAPNRIPLEYENKIFLAGSIDQGKAIDWQTDVCNRLGHIENLLIMNPRRDDWDSSWDNTNSENKELTNQIKWELIGMNESTTIMFYFDVDQQSPITLLELGMALERTNVDKSYYESIDVFVCCPTGYFRKANVDVTCELYGITVYETLDEVVEALIHHYAQ